jgi:hypothetical protein
LFGEFLFHLQALTVRLHTGKFRFHLTHEQRRLAGIDLREHIIRLYRLPFGHGDFRHPARNPAAYGNQVAGNPRVGLIDMRQPLVDFYRAPSTAGNDQDDSRDMLQLQVRPAAKIVAHTSEKPSHAQRQLTSLFIQRGIAIV